MRCDAMRRDVDVDVDVVGYIAGLNASWYGGFRHAGALGTPGFELPDVIGIALRASHRRWVSANTFLVGRVLT